MEWVAEVEPVEVLRRKASMGVARVALSLGGKRRRQGRKTRWFRHHVRKTESWSSWPNFLQFGHFLKKIYVWSSGRLKLIFRP